MSTTPVVPYFNLIPVATQPITRMNYGDVTTDLDDDTKMMIVSWRMYPVQLPKFRVSPPGSQYHSRDFDGEQHTKWTMSVTPNGMSEGNAGSSLLRLLLNSMPDSFAKMTVYYNLRCNETGASYQAIVTLDDTKRAIGWNSQIQLLSELSDLEKLSFSCIFRILRIEYKNGEPNYEYPLEISSIPRKERFIWNVDEELTRKMANATEGKGFAADDILSSSGLFSVNLYPNELSVDDQSEGKVNVYLSICALPIGVSMMEVKCTILVPELGESTFTAKFNRQFHCWGGEIESFKKFQSGVTKIGNIVVNTEIMRLYDMKGCLVKNGVLFMHFANVSLTLFFSEYLAVRLSVVCTCFNSKIPMKRMQKKQVNARSVFLE